MGTLAVTYNGTTKNYTLTGAPAVAYGGSTRLSASGWSGTRVLKCANKLMSTDVTIGSLKLPTKGTLAKTDIKLVYTVKGETYYTRNVNDTSSLTIPEGYNKATFFAVGGGGTSGGIGGRVKKNVYVYCCTGGGGGGYTASKTVDVSKGDVFTFSIGAGAKGVWYSSSAPASRGGTTYVYKNGSTIVSAAGGYTSAGVWAKTGTSAGGAGGSGGGGSGWWNGDYSANRGAAGNGGTNGGNGTAGGAAGGKGQGTSTTYHGVVYSGGGGGGNGGQGSLGIWSSNGIGGKYGGGNGIGYKSTGQTSGTEGSGGGGGGYSDEWGSSDDEGGSNFWSNSASTYSLISGGSGAVVIRLYEQ